MRPSGRATDEMRQVTFTRNFTCHAEGSVLVEFGNTKVICTASIEENVPGWMRGKGKGWVTAEYSMFRESIERAGFSGELEGPNQFTLFVPSNTKLNEYYSLSF